MPVMLGRPCDGPVRGDALDRKHAATHAGNVWYFDASVGIAIGRMLAEPGVFKGLSLLVSSTNLADKLPPYSTHFRGYDVYNYDLVGRTIFARLRLQI